MIKLYIEDTYNPRKYTDAFYDYLLEIGSKEKDIILDLLYWLSDEDVKRFAELRDFEFIEIENYEDTTIFDIENIELVELEDL